MTSSTNIITITPFPPILSHHIITLHPLIAHPLFTSSLYLAVTTTQQDQRDTQRYLKRAWQYHYWTTSIRTVLVVTVVVEVVGEEIIK